jgi:hypothetical protein
VTLDDSVDTFEESQCDEIGKNFAIWAKFFSIGRIFFKKKSPHDFGEILAENKLVGRLFGLFLWSLGDFFTKTSGHPDYR